jgi:hypothetical protein
MIKAGGECCNSYSVCNNKCCSSGEICTENGCICRDIDECLPQCINSKRIDLICCALENVFGSACCQTDHTTGQFVECFDIATSLCCLPTYIPCDSRCCPSSGGSCATVTNDYSMDRYQVCPAQVEECRNLQPSSISCEPMGFAALMNPVRLDVVRK